jgi:hypothetical protein
MTDGRSGRARPDDRPAPPGQTRHLFRAAWPPAVTATLLALAAFAAAHSSPGFARVEPPADIVPTLRAPAPIESFTAGSPATSTSGHLPAWLSTVGVVLGAAAVAAVVGALLWTLTRDLLRRRDTVARRGRRAGPRRGAAQTAEEVVAALDAGLVELSDTDADPRRAVIACWVRLEQTAEAAGIDRRPGDTPTDLVTRLLRTGRPVSAGVLAAFAEVYREARYATHTVDERMRAQARSALRRLRTELTTVEAAG